MKRPRLSCTAGDRAGRAESPPGAGGGGPSRPGTRVGHPRACEEARPHTPRAPRPLSRPRGRDRSVPTGPVRNSASRTLLGITKGVESNKNPPEGLGKLGEAHSGVGRLCSRPSNPTEQKRGGEDEPTQAETAPAPAPPPYPPSSAPLLSQPGGCARGRRLSPEREPGVSAPLPDSCRYRYTRKFTSSLVTLILASPRSDGVLTTRRPPPAGEGTGESKSCHTLPGTFSSRVVSDAVDGNTPPHPTPRRDAAQATHARPALRRVVTPRSREHVAITETNEPVHPGETFPSK